MRVHHQILAQCQQEKEYNKLKQYSQQQQDVWEPYLEPWLPWNLAWNLVQGLSPREPPGTCPEPAPPQAIDSLISHHSTVGDQDSYATAKRKSSIYTRHFAQTEKEHPRPNSIRQHNVLSSIRNCSALFFSVQCSVLVFSSLSKSNSGNSWWHYDDDSGLHM